MVKYIMILDNVFLFNAYTFFRMIRNTGCCRLLKQEKQKAASSLKANQNSGEIYDQIEENTNYQELGEVSKPTVYETII